MGGRVGRLADVTQGIDTHQSTGRQRNRRAIQPSDRLWHRRDRFMTSTLHRRRDFVCGRLARENSVDDQMLIANAQFLQLAARPSSLGIEVLPTPPLPVKNRLRVGWLRNRILLLLRLINGRTSNTPYRHHSIPIHLPLAALPAASS